MKEEGHFDRFEQVASCVTGTIFEKQKSGRQEEFATIEREGE